MRRPILSPKAVAGLHRAVTNLYDDIEDFRSEGRKQEAEEIEVAYQFLVRHGAWLLWKKEQNK